MKKERIFVATPSYTQICCEQARQRCNYNWFEFGRTFGHDVELGFNTNQGGCVELSYQSMYERAKEFDADWFVTFEADMMPERGGHTFTSLWYTIKRRGLDHLAALYFLNDEEEPWPLLFKEADTDMDSAKAEYDHRAYINFRAYPQNRLVAVDGTGLGCTFIRMDALKRIETESPFWRKAGDSIFKINSPFSVDMAICKQLRWLGYELWVHTGVIVDHVSRLPMVINERHYQKRFAEVYWPEDAPKWQVERENQINRFKRWVKGFVDTKGKDHAI